MQRISKLFITAAAGLLLVAAPSGAVVRAVPGAAKAEFKATAKPPVAAAFTFVGTTRSVSVTEKDGKLAVSVNLSTLDTKEGTRDAHLRKHLKLEPTSAELAAEKDDPGLDPAERDRRKKLRDARESRRFAVLTVERSKLEFPNAEKPKTKAKSKGKLRLNDQTREVEFAYEARADGERIAVTGGIAQLKFTDFGIAKPEYSLAGVVLAEVRDAVDIAVEFSVTDK
jgi:polyisoprenoid-binding protein YceI